MTGFTYPKDVGGQGGEAWQERIYDEEAARTTRRQLGVHPLDDHDARPDAHGVRHRRAASASSSRACSPARTRGASCSASPAPAPTSPASRAARCATATTSSSPGRRCGTPPRSGATTACCSRAPTPTRPKHHGITFLLVDMDSPGIEVRPLIQATGAAHFNEVFFEDVRVPVANVLGEIDGGWAAARTVMSNESAMIGGSRQQHVRQPAPARAGSSGAPTTRSCGSASPTATRASGRSACWPTASWPRCAGASGRPSTRRSSSCSIAAEPRDLRRPGGGDRGPAGAAQSDDEVSRWVDAELLGRYGISIGGGTNEVQRNNLAERAARPPQGAEHRPRVAWSETLRS